MIVLGVWMRSRVVYDCTLFTIGNRQHEINSLCGRVSWQSWRLDDDDGITRVWFSVSPPQDVLLEMVKTLANHSDYRRAHNAMSEWATPYWFLVLAIGLPSAFLILWPRKEISTPTMRCVVNAATQDTNRA